MAVTLTWGVAAMECFARLGQFNDVVFKVSWTLTALNDENGSTASTQGVQTVPVDPDVPFTPYPDLTEPQVVGWVKTALGTELVTQYEADVTNQVNPEIISPALPWAPLPTVEPDPIAPEAIEVTPMLISEEGMPFDLAVADDATVSIDEAAGIVTEEAVADAPTDTVASTTEG